MAGPEHTLIKPGEVRNPGGRPKGVSIVKYINKLMVATWDEIQLANESQNPQERLAAAWVIRAYGDQKSMEALTNRTDSAVAQSVKMDIRDIKDEETLKKLLALERARLAGEVDDDYETPT